MSLIRKLDGISDAAAYDAAGRLRVSNLRTLADLKIIDTDDAIAWESVGTGTDTFNNNTADLAVTSGQFRIRATRRSFPYYSAKPTVVQLTAHNFHHEANVEKALGYFSSSAVSPFTASLDGFRISQRGDGSGVYFEIWKNGSLVQEIDQGSWLRPMSGKDWSKFSAFEIDYLWLGGAGVRLFVRDETTGKWEKVVEYTYAGVGTFTLSPSHKVRYEIRSTTGTGTFSPICAVVLTEGDISECGYQFSVDNGAGVTMATLGTKYLMLAIRKRAAQRNVAVKFTDLAGMVLSNTDYLKLTVEINPTLSAALSYAQAPGRPVDIAAGTGAQTVTANGRIIATAFLSQNGILPSGLLDDDFSAWLGMLLDNTPEPIVICGTPLSGGVTAHVSADLIQI